MRRFIFLFLLGFFLLTHAPFVKADELDDVTHQLENLKKIFNDIKKATDTNEATLDNLKKQLGQILLKVEDLGLEINKKENEVKQGEKVLTYQKNLLNERARSYYKNIAKSTQSLINFLAAENLSTSLKNFTYQKSLVDEDRKTIIKVVLYIKNLEDKKISLQSERERLAALKTDIDKQSKFLEGEVVTARKYQGELLQKIAALSAQQQQLIAQKLASLNIPRSAGTAASACVDDRDKDPGFSPRLAFFTYGVPNRVGMNQYGAYGRAKAGQDYQTILRAYYNFDEFKDVDVNTQIRVDGHGSFNLEDYVKRIYEVPNSWGDNGGMEALKAQAVAARSYVLAYTNNGSGSICDSQSCQVFQDGEKGGNWNVAVEATRGKVMAQGGSAIKSWYSSTHGGYVFSSGEIGWSSTSWTKHANDFVGSVGSFADLHNNAYDKESAWFYCDWGSRSEYNKTAWLKPQEIADIVNVILLAKRDSGVIEHLYQTDKSNPAGVDTWDTERVKSELRSRGGSAYNSITDVAVSVDFGGGRTTSVNFSGDAGSTSFDAREFKDWFNLRAPANIQIVGPLYNVEKR
ncbi:hypothetical protein A2954_02380 [Candidatus Roizmanbacteria bacterium RIFCSPLOWO2_01_FULL_37_12]|uniref:Sporulation stage II protein D amidase enhancer LytB N-terminal domain-containing protein n=1 Tax=Candidatus Roizmanbacteria bacterium RIFCSPLOWO2_01_FULL_37_12 TaxID=1802056 RepID=A0A1F7I8C4_9BACT|nr:MAG: hypothetical protein A2954_02380 [Candidatus Roizmanbacteria bacterium RIFCSPLOWO2_01_FULL_37_12]